MWLDLIGEKFIPFNLIDEVFKINLLKKIDKIKKQNKKQQQKQQQQKNNNKKCLDESPQTKPKSNHNNAVASYIKK